MKLNPGTKFYMKEIYLVRKRIISFSTSYSRNWFCCYLTPNKRIEYPFLLDTVDNDVSFIFAHKKQYL